MWRKGVLLLCLSVALIGDIVFAQTDYSADIVDLQQTGNPVLAKLYVSRDKRRIEFQPASGKRALISPLRPPAGQKDPLEVDISGVGKVIILNIADKTSVLLEPDQKFYLETSWGDPLPSGLYIQYVYGFTGDAEDFCPGWIQRIKSDGATCNKAGHESVDGRRAVRYEESVDGGTVSVWFDAGLHALLRRTSNRTSTELRNVREGPQPTSLFEVPKGYSPMPPLGGIVGRYEPE